MWEFLNDKIFTTWTSPERPFCYWVPLLNLATTTPSAGRGWQASTENGWLAPLSYATSTCLQCNDKWTPINLLWTKTTGTWVYFLFFTNNQRRGVEAIVLATTTKQEKCTYALDADSYQENIAAKLFFPWSIYIISANQSCWLKMFLYCWKWCSNLIFIILHSKINLGFEKH